MIRTQNVRHLVLEVLSRNKRVQQLLTTLNHGVNLSTASTEVRIVVERFPQVVDRLAAWLRTRIDENTDLGLQSPSVMAGSLLS